MHFYKSSNLDNELHLQSQIKGSLQKKGGDISKSFLVLSGEIFFAAIDLRINSNLFGEVRTKTIRENYQVSIPRMVATGFQVLSTNATILYFLDSVHKPHEDITINPSSCGINWPLPLGAISSRDSQALTLNEYIESLR
jgi:dTDP-4-dehydrorhamnose 3,5-epimerase